MSVDIRHARPEDHDDVAAFTADTWPDRDVGDYIADIYPEWIADDGDGQQTFAAEEDGTVVGVAQAVKLSEWEAWGQGLRVHPEHRRKGIAIDLTRAVWDWAREQGLPVFRVMIFSWNVASLGHARVSGYDPCTEFRWAHPEPDATADPNLRVTDDAAAGWAFWTACEARNHLRGLALDFRESWAVSELTREELARAADDGRLFVVNDGGTRGLTVRNRTYERDGETWAEYAVGAWADAPAAEALFDAVARDAASVGADRTRMLIPEGVEWVTDVAAAGASLSDEPDFVMAADVTDDIP